MSKKKLIELEAPKRPAPTFTLPASNGKKVSLKDFKGKKLVIYFYPQDNTPTCTQQSCDFRDYNGKFAKLGVKVIGISPDELKAHDKFIEKYELPFLLLSDPDHQVAEKFGVWALKKLYGREYMGIVRSTFLIDEEGYIVKEWSKVRVKNHVQSVLDAVMALNTNT
ncbi:thioredoxin-dependent thiol peroxidase [Paenibacillus alginolyticus]|uniref:thioredoxin-dependent peroxiredoxin n=1 Tax=Paenibacillus alginolyticus TaxID=59839 RepID=A0ABT4GIN6_9BACL|nr:thioredoxin-dependent thiol peroxidase [Paenibacillus alginolyticus]MCY9666315.1 thioredoxin-dependent thiol peroxidase [Paenibacillus alginolyticus]MCY9696025.1 thioredoxin-dependent thiol peroxidase [Paenibacillus alginolyticus]MEC0143411.1 thioredoxin-dependent thiol peroxidase [Paenibacillus alginolyticus]